jgi:hypothetical protein
MNPVTNRQDAHPRERGSILAFTGIALLTLVGMTVVGVDLGRLAFTATEVQAVAEVAATGYAHAWLRGLSTGTDPGDGTCAAEALTVVDGNRIDTKKAAAKNIEGYERGFYDFDTDGPFTTAVPAGQSANAVRATGTATVNNFFAALFAAPKSTVRKTAVATLTCGTRAQPFPMIIQDCLFGGFDGPEDCPNLPALTQQNVHEEDSCFTSLSGSSASTGRISDLIAQACCPGGPGTCDLPADYPSVSQGEDVKVINGQSSMLKALQTCWDNGYREFLVPITPCGAACNQTNVISGFANMTLSERPVASGSPKYVALSSFCNASDEVDGRGGNCYGAFKVAMVE